MRIVVSLIRLHDATIQSNFAENRIINKQADLFPKKCDISSENDRHLN
jgi:hypothetical protein